MTYFSNILEECGVHQSFTYFVLKLMGYLSECFVSIVLKLVELRSFNEVVDTRLGVAR